MARVVSDDEWGAFNVWAEARGEPFEGQVAVGNVVRNRMRKQYSSDGSVVDTIFRPYQFSWTHDNSYRRQVFQVDDENHSYQEALAAWRASAYQDAVPPSTVLYHADYVEPDWAERVTLVRQIGRHKFYEERS